jgi:hypothetical protein
MPDPTTPNHPMLDAPIACTLTPGQYADRTGDLASLAARALRTRKPTAAGERIAAEASCCSFLRMDLQRSGDGLVLDVAGPQDARPVIAELFAAFNGATRASTLVHRHPKRDR